MFNPAIKVVDAPQKEKKILPAKEDKEELGFSLFEQAEKDPPAEKGTRVHFVSQTGTASIMCQCFMHRILALGNVTVQEIVCNCKSMLYGFKKIHSQN